MTKLTKFSCRYYLRPRNLPCDGIDSVIGGDIRPFDTENHNSQQPLLELEFTNWNAKIALLRASMVVTYHIKVFQTGANRHNGISMSLLLLVAETIKSSEVKTIKVRKRK